jgi:Fic family protein
LYSPNFKYTHRLVNDLSAIERISGILNERKVLDYGLRRAEFTTKCAFITEILQFDGIEVSVDVVRQVLEGSASLLAPHQKQAVLNLRTALEYLDTFLRGKSINETDLQELNLILLQDLPNSSRLRGKYRQIQTWVVDKTNEKIIFTPPSPELVIESIKNFLEWLSSDASKIHPPILRAGIAHQWLMCIQPFVHGNEGVAWLITKFIIQEAGFDLTNLTTITEPFYKNIHFYRQVLYWGMQGTRIKEDSVIIWLEYFTGEIRGSFEQALRSSRELVPEETNSLREEKAASEFQKESEIERIPSSAGTSPDLIMLNERQRLILGLGKKYTTFHRRDVRAELQIAHRYNPKTISRDLKSLMEMGLLEKGGERKGTYYRLKVAT